MASILPPSTHTPGAVTYVCVSYHNICSRCEVLSTSLICTCMYTLYMHIVIKVFKYLIHIYIPCNMHA